MRDFITTDLSVNFAGLSLNNPLLVAAGPLITSVQRAKKAEKAGAGAIVTKLIVNVSPETKWMVLERPRYIWNSKYKAVIDVTEARLSLQQGMDLVRKLKKEVRIPVIGNIMDRSVNLPNLEGWLRVANAIEEAGADMLELNVSCEHIVRLLGHHSNLVPAIVKTIAKNSSVPISVKIPPSLDPERIIQFAKACKDSGGDAITAINGGPAIFGVDIEHAGRPSYEHINVKKAQYLDVAAMGPYLKPISLWVVATITANVDIQVSGVGGIMDWRDAVEMLMLGANNIQVCTALIVHGFGLLQKMTEGLNSFMRNNGYETIEAFRGAALKYFGGNVEVLPIKVKVLSEKCTGCGVCANFGSCDAISMGDKVAQVDIDKCSGCALCIQFCPAKAIVVARALKN